MFTKNSFVFAGVFLVLGVLIAVASVRGEPQRRLKLELDADASRRVEPAALADWMIAGRRDFAVVDMRSVQDFEKGHVKGAVNCGSCHENRAAGQKAMHAGFVDLSKKLVLYTQSDAETIVLPKLLHDNPRIYRLSGGWERWEKDVLGKVSFEGLADADALDAAKKREAVRAFMSGERPAAASEAKLPVTPVRRTGEHKAAATSEGC
ncbi:MAG: rhodanese-like domain-containing protein [Myxococcales bacterium]